MELTSKIKNNHSINAAIIHTFSFTAVVLVYHFIRLVEVALVKASRWSGGGGVAGGGVGFECWS